jgi:hypothetical protein
MITFAHVCDFEVSTFQLIHPAEICDENSILKQVSRMQEAVIVLIYLEFFVAE